MVMKKGEVYRCTNRRCNCEVVVWRASELEGSRNPMCCCGSEMKKPYAKPGLHELTAAEVESMRVLFDQK